MTQLWRLQLSPKGGDADRWLTADLCIEKGLVGMGWPVTDGENRCTKDFEWYRKAADEVYGPGEWSSVWHFAQSMKQGDLVWFRHPEGRYYAAEIIGPWEYRYEGNYIPADMINIRPARIVEVGLADRVPGKIISCFRPPRTLQKISGGNMLIFTKHLLGMPVETVGSDDVLDYLTDQDLENVAAIYLQTKGWLLIPGTRRLDTPHYEFVLVNSQTGDRGIVQVKSGRVSLNAIDYEGSVKTFLFAASGNYGDVIPDNVDAIAPNMLRAFIVENKRLLPAAVVRWMEIAGTA